MASSNNFLFKHNRVYGLPTVWGLAMFFVVGMAFWYSAFTQAPAEQWMSFLMTVLILLHLAEANNPFRSIEVQLLAHEPTFAGEPSFLSIVISNPTNLKSEPLFLRTNRNLKWVEVSALAPKTSVQVQLPLLELPAGRHPLPQINLKSRPASQLFQLWKVLRTKNELIVLPTPKDQGVEMLNSVSSPAEAELSHLEPIRDSRMMFKLDHKIFLKTGKPYYRATETSDAQVSIMLDWSKLSKLNREQRSEQFSDWLKKSAAFTKTSSANEITIRVESPFLTTTALANSFDWQNLKQKFGEWIYE